jgi:hypothetical protein
MGKKKHVILSEIATASLSPSQAGKVPVYNPTTNDFDLGAGGSGGPTGATGPAGIPGDPGMNYVKLSYSQLEIQSLNSVPQTLVSAPGIGALIWLHSAIVKFNYGGDPLVGGSYFLEIYHDGSPDNLMSNKIMDSTVSVINQNIHWMIRKR